MVAVDREWAEANLGAAPESVSAARDAGVPTVGDGGLMRDVIDFDSEAGEGRQLLDAVAPKAANGLSKFVDIPWPTGLAPVPAKSMGGATDDSLPGCDVLIVTWTVDEGHALSRVLTPGFDSRDDWKQYTKNYAEIAKHMVPTAPARSHSSRFLGTYWTATVGDRKVTLFKSNSHMSQDGPELPNATVWRQIIEDCAPKLVITTGTGGGIGPDAEVGDVIVSRYVTFDCQREFKRLNQQSYVSAAVDDHGQFASANHLFDANAKFLPATNTRPPRIVTARSAQTGIVTTDFFGFDDTDNTYGLQGKGDLSEMGDAVLGMVCQQIGADAPPYVIVRNVSDPQISSTGMSLAEQAAFAANIYKGYGRWSTVCSAIVCWALVVSL